MSYQINRLTEKTWLSHRCRKNNIWQNSACTYDNLLLLTILSCVRLFVTLWTIAHHAPLSVGFFSGMNTAVVAISFSRGTFPTQESNSHLLCLLPWRQILFPLSHQENPFMITTLSKPGKNVKFLSITAAIYKKSIAVMVTQQCGCWCQWTVHLKMGKMVKFAPESLSLVFS